MSFDTERYAQRSQERPRFVCAILADRPHHEVYEDADMSRSEPGRLTQEALSDADMRIGARG